MNADRLLECAQRIDPACCHDNWRAEDARAREAAAKRVLQLLHAWYSRVVPVVKLWLDGPLDVLQVFARVNRAGTDVAGDDVFFAGVKTRWQDAEEHVERVRLASPLLSRTAALRVMARLANYELGHGDLVPLDVERLHGDRGPALVKQMVRFAEPDSREIVRIREISELAIEKSGLGHALNVIHPTLLDHMFVWAVVREQWPPPPEQLNDLWCYLFGASAFRYREIFAVPFDRLAFKQARTAGLSNERFPLSAIANECRAGWPGLHKRPQRVRAVSTDEERRDFVNNNKSMALYHPGNNNPHTN